MKYYIVFIGVIWTLCSCQEQRHLKHPNRIKQISFYTSNCLGKCPELSIEIDSSLNYKFLGGYLAEKEGFFKGKVSQVFWDSLNIKVEAFNFERLDSVYDKGYFDADLKKVVIQYENKTKTVIGDSWSLPDSMLSTLYWLQNSYRNFALQPTDTLMFATDTATFAYTHEEKKFFSDKRILDYADSLLKTGKKGLTSKNIDSILKKLDKGHPSDFFRKAYELAEIEKYNDASLIYYVGHSRYMYFKSASPTYTYKSEDETLLFSLDSKAGSSVGLFLVQDLDNMKIIIEKCRDWIKTKDYVFFTRTNNPTKYNDQIFELDKLIGDLSSEEIKKQKAEEYSLYREHINEMVKSLINRKK